VYGEAAEILLHSKKTSAPAYDHSASFELMDTGKLQANVAPELVVDSSTAQPKFTMSGAGQSSTFTGPANVGDPLALNRAFEAHG